LEVEGQDGLFVVQVPLDPTDCSPRLIHFGDDGQPDEKPIKVELTSFAGEPFPVPRPEGDTSVPERITYKDCEESKYICSIELYNDAHLPTGIKQDQMRRQS